RFTSREAFGKMFIQRRPMSKRGVLAAAVLAGLLSLAAGGRPDWSEAVDKAEEIADLIARNYINPPDARTLAFASIRGVLGTLDPHSYFLDSEMLSTMREEYTGKFYGMGIQITKQEDRLVVISCIEGMPASRLGIQPGDVIATIDGASTKPLSSYEAMQKLRGPKGSKVTITIQREGFDKPIELVVIREEIPLHSVSYAFLRDDRVGYIYIRTFSETTVAEVEAKIADLAARGMTGLILDLRWNTGGPFFPSLELADEFLAKGSLIVSIRGRNRSYDREFRAVRDGQQEGLPLVVLVNAGSASASEIVAGAVMDNDRGLVVGEDSWGKGLVQTVFPLGPDLAVALTTAKYYTPSGRSIQRDYTHLEDYLLNTGVQDESREVRYTKGGRKVLGQGGITPDYKVQLRIKPLTAELIFRGAFFSYGRKFVGRQTDLSKSYVLPQDEEPAGAAEGRTVLSFAFTADAAVLADFKEHLRSLKFEYSPERFAEAEDEIRTEIEREVVSSAWNLEEGMRVYRCKDPVVQKAMAVLPEAAGFLR
ncbi:MAG: S41 family peptidase, partial [Candidatus Aminicenantes bacterium]|nr:S41 family peptidase [Candidatus Aminicenantes bacterium]